MPPSGVPNLILEWSEGNLNRIDPVTGASIATMEQEGAARLAAEAQYETVRLHLKKTPSSRGKRNSGAFPR